MGALPRARRARKRFYPAPKVLLGGFLHKPLALPRGASRLLPSGLAESKQGGDELKIGDAETDGRAVEAIVDCFYSGQLSLSSSTVSSVIRTADLLRVDAVEKEACDFFVESLEVSTACEALAFAAAHSGGGEHARGLHGRCAAYRLQRSGAFG